MAENLISTPELVKLARPSVLSLVIKDNRRYMHAYMPFITNGGIFVATNKSYRVDDEIYYPESDG